MKELTDMLASLFNCSDKLDLTNPEDVKKAHDLIDYFRNDKLSQSVLKVFVGDDFDLDNLDQLIDDIYEKSTYIKEEELEKKKVNKDLIDHPNKQIENKEEKTIARPSMDISVEAGLQIHKLVQEYVDTMIKPYSNGILNTDQINNAYAGLYEFACWIYNKK